MRRALTRKLMLVGGAMIGFINVLPLPWFLRLSWAKFLYWLTVKGTLRFPYLFAFVQSQNIAYGIGKQRGESLPSILQLEKVLESLESDNVPLDRIKELLHSGAGSGVTPEALPQFIASSVYGREEAKRIMRTTSRDRQTW